MRKRKIIIISISFLLFLAIGLQVRGTNEGILFDNLILDIIHKNHSQVLFTIMKAISFIGSAYFLIPVTLVAIVYALTKKDYYVSKLLLISTLGSYGVNFLFKFLFQRARPLEYFLVEQGGLSYPSGHTMVNMTFYMTLGYILSHRYKKTKNTKWIYFFLYTMIILMGISRLYLGVHWPTDVLGGYLMGYVFFKSSILLVKE